MLGPEVLLALCLKGLTFLRSFFQVRVGQPYAWHPLPIRVPGITIPRLAERLAGQLVE